jgi:hypothetical protein
MWNPLLGALAIMGMLLVGLILVPGAPKLIDAISDRIRYGVQKPVEHELEDEDEDLTEENKEAPVATTKPRKVHAA